MVFLIFSNKNKSDPSMGQNLVSNTGENMQQLISNPRFISSDSKNRPYTLVAKKAVKIRENLKIYELTHPEGNLIRENGQFLNVKSLGGIFNQETEILSLKNNVTLENQDGYIFKTESASIDLNKENIYGDKKVIGNGPKGTVKSQGFKINENGKKVYFLGKSKLLLKNQ